jgi:lipopolysaccharide export system permease protein
VKNVRRLLFGDVVQSVGFVALAFLSLFFFLDLVEELRNLGREGYTVLGAIAYSVLELPGHLYELAPIAVLIGSIYALARLAQSTEFTILRTSGLGPGRALALLAQVGLAFTIVTFLVGDLVAPLSGRIAAQLQASAAGGYGLGATGAWLKERRQTPEGDRSYSVNVRAATGDGVLRDIRIFEFDDQGRLLQRWTAATGRVDSVTNRWKLGDVNVTAWPGPAASAGNARVQTRQVAEAEWETTLNASVVAAAVMPESTMSTLELLRYVGHLAQNEQASQAHEIAFWKRAVYPFACIVMVALALPFAYLHARGGGVSLKVFGGIMLGISFVLMNNVAGHLGLLRSWTPWVVASMPSLLYLGLSLLAFAWLVRFR